MKIDDSINCAFRERRMRELLQNIVDDLDDEFAVLISGDSKYITIAKNGIDNNGCKKILEWGLQLSGNYGLLERGIV